MSAEHVRDHIVHTVCPKCELPLVPNARITSSELPPEPRCDHDRESTWAYNFAFILTNENGAFEVLDMHG